MPFISYMYVGSFCPYVQRIHSSKMQLRWLDCCLHFCNYLLSIEPSIFCYHGSVYDASLQPTTEERAAIFAALVKADHTLRGRSYNSPGGHMMRCPNGHAYFIGNCGGATQQSRCPECGVTIGGRSHQLAPGNTVDRTVL